MCCLDDGNLECGVDNPIYLDGLDVSSVADLGIKVMGPQVMSNFWIIGKILMCSQCLLSMSLRLYSDWIQWKSMILATMASLTLWNTRMLYLLLRVE